MAGPACALMWPRWQLFEPAIRRAAGLGHAADAADPDGHDEVSRQVDLLVQQAHAAGVELHTRCTVFGLYDHGLAAAVQTPDGALRERLWKTAPRRTVLASGAFEHPLLFPDNGRPGVMLANAVQRCASLHGGACGASVVIADACDSACGVAHTLRAAGMTARAIVDHRAQPRPRTGRRAGAGRAQHRRGGRRQAGLGRHRSHVRAGGAAARHHLRGHLRRQL